MKQTSQTKAKKKNTSQDEFHQNMANEVWTMYFSYKDKPPEEKEAFWERYDGLVKTAAKDNPRVTAWMERLKKAILTLEVEVPKKKPGEQLEITV